LQAAIKAHLYPKSYIHVHISILEANGELSTLAMAVNCGCAAVVDAGIECKDRLSAAACAKGEHGEIILDPADVHEKLPQLLLGFMADTNEISLVDGKGRPLPYPELKDACVKSAIEYREAINEALA